MIRPMDHLWDLLLTSFYLFEFYVLCFKTCLNFMYLFEFMVYDWFYLVYVLIGVYIVFMFLLSRFYNIKKAK